MQRIIPSWAAVTLATLLVLTSVIIPGAAPVAAAVAARPPAFQDDTAADVPTFRGDAARTGSNPGPGPEEEPDIRWRVRTGAEVFAAPAVVDGVVYAGSGDGFVYALEAASGEEIWRFRTEDAVYTTPTVSGASVYAVSGGLLYALDRATGEEVWRSAGARVDSAPALAGGTLYVTGGYPEVLSAIDAETGDARWLVETTEEDGSIDAALAVAGGVVYVGSFFGTGGVGTFAAFDAATGDERWRVDMDHEIHDAAAVAGETVFVVGYEVLYALDTATGAERWRYDAGSSSTVEPTVHDGTVYLRTNGGEAIAVEAASGEERWRAPVTFSPSAPTAAGQALYLASDTGLVALDAADGSERWSLESEEAFTTEPVVTGGVVYSGLGERDIVALGGGGGEPGAKITSSTAEDMAPDPSDPGDPGDPGETPAATAAAGIPAEAGAAPRGPTRTGEQPGPGPDGEPSELWRLDVAPLGSFGRAEVVPVVADGRLYAGGEDGFAALDAATGEEIWRVETGGYGAAAVAGGVVFAGGEDGVLSALDAATGDERWRLTTGDRILSTPAVVDGTVYFGSQDGFLYAADAETGEERWRFDTFTMDVSSPVVAGDIVYAGDGDSSLYALDLATGAEIWSVDAGEGIFVGATVSQGLVLAAENDYATMEGTVIALDAATGRERWRFAGGFLGGPVAVAGGMVYAGNGAEVTALDLASGAERWSVEAGVNVSAPSIVDGTVYATTGEEVVPTDEGSPGDLIALDAETGGERWRINVAEEGLGAPVVAGGIIYVGSRLELGGAGAVYALGTP